MRRPRKREGGREEGSVVKKSCGGQKRCQNSTKGWIVKRGGGYIREIEMGGLQQIHPYRTWRRKGKKVPYSKHGNPEGYATSVSNLP